MTYSSEVLADSPLAYWRLGESSGTSAADSSGNGRNATYVGSPTLGATGAVSGDTAAEFDGSSQYVQSDAASWQEPSAFTAEAWIRPDSTSSLHAIVAKDSPAAGFAFYVLDGVLSLYTNGTGHAGTATIPTGTWTHVAATFSGGTIKLYVNGSLDATLSGSYGSSGIGTPLLVGVSTGSNGGTSRFFRWDGRLDEVAFYGTALSGTRIAAHYAEVAGSTPSGSLAATLPALTAALAGTSDAPTVTGAADATLPALSAVLGGHVDGTPATGTLEATLPALSLSADVDVDEDGSEYSAPLPDLDLPVASVPDPERLIRLKAISVPPVELGANGRPTEAWKAQAVEFDDVWGAYRFLVNGEDVTDFRGYPIQIGAREHKPPFGYAAMDVVIPGVTPWETETWGSGDLAWKHPAERNGDRVVLQVVDAAGNAEVLFVGFVGSVDPATEGLRLTCAGEARGRLQFAENLLRPFAAFRDIGRIAYDLARRPGLKITPAFGLETGYVVNQQSRAGGKLLEALEEYCALSQQPTGERLTFQPTGADGDVFEMQWTDAETVHYTVFFGAHGITPDLQSNIIDRPTSSYGVGRDDEGGFWANFKARLSALASPPPFPGTISPGDEGVNVNIWQANLISIGGYLKRRDAAGGFNAATEQATKDLQDDAGLPQTGVVNEATWNAGFDIAVTGTVTSNGHMVPLAQLNSTKRFFETSTGIPYVENPDYDATRPRVEEIIDYGVFEKKNARRRSRGRRARLANAQMWAGTLRLDTDLFVGDYHHGDPDPVLASRFVPLDGKNIMLRGWDGDTLIQVAGDVKDERGATVTGDTMGLPPLEVRQIVERNKEARQSKNPGKTFVRQHRGTEIGGPIEFISELGGELPLDQDLDGDRWNLLDEGIVAGDMGTLSQIRLALTSPVCEFAVALFASPVTEAWCNANLPHPFAEPKAWKNASVRAMIQGRVLLGAWGDQEEPCGYGEDGLKSEDDPLTGIFLDAAGIDYRTFADEDVNNGKRGKLYMVVFPKVDTTAEAQRVFWPSYEVGM